MPLIPMLIVTGLFLTAGGGTNTSQPEFSGGVTHWLAVELKAHTIAVHPRTGEQRELPDVEPHGVHSPDGTTIIFKGTEPDSGRHSDLFVADLDPAQPTGNSNTRRISTTQDRPTAPHWLPDSQRVVFLALVDENLQLFAVDAVNGGEPIMVSDGAHAVYGRLQVTSDGRVAYHSLVRRDGKAMYFDLHLLALAPEGVAVQDDKVIVRETLMRGFAFSPDTSRLVYSTHGSLVVVDLSSGHTSQIECKSIHESMWNDIARNLAWHPDGSLIAARFRFGGGRQIMPGREEESKLFSDDKIVFVPAPPMAGAAPPQDEAPPPRPWWVTFDEQVLDLRWIPAPAR